ncbi:MAG: hypothetical protein KAS66_13510 [Candidatus Omnitrophica bacterium]|nr:hypothetical protein [Candidatus Omnitrophota bacterium]
MGDVPKKFRIRKFVAKQSTAAIDGVRLYPVRVNHSQCPSVKRCASGCKPDKANSETCDMYKMWIACEMNETGRQLEGVDGRDD